MKTWTLILLGAFAMSSQVMADTGGGFKNDDTPPPQHKQDSGQRGTKDAHENNVERIKKTQSLNWVTLEGFIIKKNGAESYTFRDKTGTIETHIPATAWDGQEVNPSDLISISGQTVKKGKEIVLNAKYVRKQ